MPPTGSLSALIGTRRIRRRPQRLLSKQIAFDLGITEVSVHRGQGMQKMGAASVADLVRIADRLGIQAERS